MTRRRALLVLAAVLGAAVIVFAWAERTTPTWYAKLRYPLRYEAIIRGHARNYDLDAALLAAVIYRESKFDPNARSASGALGLMQLLPATARGIALHTGGSRFVVSDLYDPEINVRYGAWYLRHLLEKYGDEQTALAAYNAGQRNVDDWRRRGEGIRFRETREYVDRVRKLAAVYRRIYPEELGRQSGA